jgi:hypothetical protein
MTWSSCPAAGRGGQHVRTIEIYSIPNPPWRHIRPCSQSIGGPLARFVRVTCIAGIRNFQQVGLVRGDEAERMTPNIDVRDGLFDFRHMASDAISARAPRPMMRVRRDRRRVRPVR